MVTIPIRRGGPRTQELAAIVPTYNRCPHPPDQAHLNPLAWCLYSLLGQRASGLRRIVVVNDASTDHTDTVVRDLTGRMTGGIEIRYLVNQRRAGPTQARNRGIDAAATEQVFFLDDDCVFRDQRALAVAQAAHQHLTAAGTRVGGMQLPVLLRADDYLTTTSQEHIGRINASAGEVYANFGAYPAEYAALRDQVDFAVALPIDFVQEVFLADTEFLAAVGGFPETGFGAVAHEGPFLSLRLRRQGLAHHYLVHPNVPLIHFRYGSAHTTSQQPSGRYPGLRIGDKHVDLDLMLAEAGAPRADTGGRATAQQIVVDVIAGRYAQLLHLSAAGADAYAQHALDALVHGRDSRGLFRFPPLDLDETSRVELWAAALRLGRTVHDQHRGPGPVQQLDQPPDQRGEIRAGAHRP